MRRVSWVSDNGWTAAFEGCGPYDGPGPFFLRELTDSLGATPETARAPRQDGATTYYTALDTRSINLTGSMLAQGSRTRPALAEYDRLRAYLAQAFAPNRWGILTYYREDEAVQIRCRPTAIPTIGTPVGVYSTLDITFTTDSPYWESAAEYVLCLGMIQRFWHFPWVPVLAPMGAFNRSAVMENPTGELIYPTVEIYSTSQHVTLTNRTTGQAVTIEHTIGPGQKLVVDLRDVSAFLYQTDESGGFGAPEDVSHWMSLDSEPWGLQPGMNQIAVANSVPEDTPLSFIKYRLPVLGI